MGEAGQHLSAKHAMNTGHSEAVCVSSNFTGDVVCQSFFRRLPPKMRILILYGRCSKVHCTGYICMASRQSKGGVVAGPCMLYKRVFAVYGNRTILRETGSPLQRPSPNAAPRREKDSSRQRTQAHLSSDRG